MSTPGPSTPSLTMGTINANTFWQHPEVQKVLLYGTYMILAGLFVGSLIALVMYITTSQDRKKTNLNDQITIRAAALEKFTDLGRNYEGFAANPNADLTEDEKYLVNYSFLTASVGGYIGPLKNGFFSQKDFLNKAFETGVRGFVLPISVYADNNKTLPNWPPSGKPAIVLREDNGEIVSQNGMTISAFCKDLLTINNLYPKYKSEPILLYLHEVTNSIPDKNKKEDIYVKLMSDIAKELGSSLDVQNADGSFTQSGVRVTSFPTLGSTVNALKQTELLTQVPMQDYQNKVLLFTNFDISKETKDAYKKEKGPRLGEYVNFLYGPAKETACANIRLNEVKGDQVNWTDRTYSKYTMSLKDSLIKVPEIDLLQQAMKKGVQVMPLPLVFLDGAEKQKVQTIVSLWQNRPYLLKPKAIRFKKPKPVEPAKPSERLNARVASNLQPGQTKI